MSRDFSSRNDIPQSSRSGYIETGHMRKSLHSGRLHTVDLVEDFLMLGKTKRLQLRENPLSVHGHFKCSTMTFNKGGNNTVFVFDGRLQTCSIRQVVSFNAVFNRDVHPYPLLTYHCRADLTTYVCTILPALPDTVKRRRESSNEADVVDDTDVCSDQKRPLQLPSGFRTGLGADGCSA